jgi:hypothetical protein
MRDVAVTCGSPRTGGARVRCEIERRDLSKHVTNLERGQKAVEVVEFIEWAEACRFDPAAVVRKIANLR